LRLELGVGGFLGLRAFGSRKRDLEPVPDDGRGDLST